MSQLSAFALPIASAPEGRFLAPSSATAERLAPAAEVAEAAQGSAASLVRGAALVAGVAVAARGARRAKRQSKKAGQVSLRALDQSSRYADLSLDEEVLIAEGKHVLVAYILKPKAGYDYLATAAHFAAESSTGTNVNVCTTDDFTKSDALVYYIGPP